MYPDIKPKRRLRVRISYLIAISAIVQIIVVGVLYRASLKGKESMPLLPLQQWVREVVTSNNTVRVLNADYLTADTKYAMVCVTLVTINDSTNALDGVGGVCWVRLVSTQDVNQTEELKTDLAVLNKARKNNQDLRWEDFHLLASDATEKPPRKTFYQWLQSLTHGQSSEPKYENDPIAVEDDHHGIRRSDQ